MMLRGSQNRQRQNMLRSRTRETGGHEGQKGGSEWTAGDEWTPSDSRRLKAYGWLSNFFFWTPRDL